MLIFYLVYVIIIYCNICSLALKMYSQRVSLTFSDIKSGLFCLLETHTNAYRTLQNKTIFTQFNLGSSTCTCTYQTRVITVIPRTWHSRSVLQLVLIIMFKKNAQRLIIAIINWKARKSEVLSHCIWRINGFGKRRFGYDVFNAIKFFRTCWTDRSK